MVWLLVMLFMDGIMVISIVIVVICLRVVLNMFDIEVVVRVVSMLVLS